MTKIFISHRSLDDNVCSQFKDMLILCGIKKEDIMYTSAKETGLVYQITPEIKQAIEESSIDIIFLSPSYLESIYCCTEMGALSMKKTSTIIFGIKGIDVSAEKGLQGSEIYIRDFSNKNDLIKILDLIEERLGVSCTKSSANEHAEKVISNYRRVLAEEKKSSKKENSNFDITSLLKIIEQQKNKIQILESSNKELNSKLNLNNQLSSNNEIIENNIVIEYSIGRRNKTKEIMWKELFFAVFANRNESLINESNVNYWIQQFLNKNEKYRISIFDSDKNKKELKVSESFIQKFLQQNITLKLLCPVTNEQKSAFGITNMYYYELTSKGKMLIDKIIKEK